MARRRTNSTAAWHRWHRRLGITAAIFVLVLAVTGFVLNHAISWGLDRHHVSGPVIDWLYDLSPDEPPAGYRVNGDWLIWLDGRLYLNAVAVAGDVPPLNGAVELDRVVVASAPPRVYLVLKDGRLLDRLDAAAVPGRIRALGLDDVGRIVAETDIGYFRLNDDFLSWSATDPYPVDWSSRDPIPPDRLEAALRADRGRGVPWQRLLLDLHTGRVAGNAGVIVMDAAAIIFVLLAGTGIVIWVRRLRRRGKKPTVPRS